MSLHYFIFCPCINWNLGCPTIQNSRDILCLCNDTVVSAGMGNGFCRDSKWFLCVHQSKLKCIPLQINYTYSTNLSSLTFLALFHQVQPDADISHISETQNEDVPDITHISETQNLLEQNVTHISETQHDRTKLSKHSVNYNKITHVY